MVGCMYGSGCAAATSQPAHMLQQKLTLLLCWMLRRVLHVTREEQQHPLLPLACQSQASGGGVHPGQYVLLPQRQASLTALHVQGRPMLQSGQPVALHPWQPVWQQHPSLLQDPCHLPLLCPACLPCQLVL
jgi:hypothetical protein